MSTDRKKRWNVSKMALEWKSFCAMIFLEGDERAGKKKQQIRFYAAS